MSNDEDLGRFVRAQEGVYSQALAEIRGGRKRSHWMWFVFPQFAGLGSSPTAEHYAIGSLEEAREYLRHPVLGARLVECAEALLALGEVSASDVFGYPDDLKLRSSMTLFELAGAPAPHPAFAGVLEKFFHGERDEETLKLVDRRKTRQP
jgi:uncharacterized protein (DUF1810 family)